MRYIFAIAEKGNISQAAKQLFIAQSSLSQFLSNYEARIGYQLFVRNTSGLTLTYSGKLYVTAAKQILDIARELQNKITDDQQNHHGEISFGVSPFRSNIVLPEILPLFHQHYPNINVNIVEGSSDELEKMVIQSEIDLAFVAFPLLHQNLRFVPVADEEIFIGCCRNHPILQKTSFFNNTDRWIDIESTLKYPYIMQAKSSRVRRIVDPLFSSATSKLEVLYYTQNIETAIRLAQKEMGLIILPGTFTSSSKDVLEFISIGEKRVFRKLAIVYPSSGYLSRVSQALIEIIKKRWQSLI